MKCPRCGRTDHEPGAKFCEDCGSSLLSTDTRLVGDELPKPNPQPRRKDSIINDILLGVIIILTIFFAGYGVYYGISNWATSHSVEYVDKVSLEAWNNRRLDPNKYDYLLNGEQEPEPITGTLIVDSSPQGADIFLDGKKTGLTSPATIEGITEGEHKVTVKMKNIKITNTWYNIGDNDYSIMFTFEEPYIPIVNR